MLFLKNVRTKPFVIISIILLFISYLHAKDTPQPKIMTLGVFHFHFPNNDEVKTEENDKISVFEEPFRSEIIDIVNVIKDYKPTIIAIEQTPAKQEKISTEYLSYINHKFDLPANEIYQLGFRIAKNQHLEQIYCIDDFGHYYESINNLFNDSLRYKKFENFFYELKTEEDRKAPKIISIVDELLKLNDPDYIDSRLSVYLTGLFKYEEQEGDFTGVDFETSRWYNRNLRILRNIQRIEATPEDRILLIIGAEHLSLLNHLFKVSEEYEFISPLPYLKTLK
ncbi:MAG: DUF5694 domain-containing protein [Candidatus Cloacimonetes bacterium]|jgi:hypothetical protein|nr:DUF5694 domain-containing protein [Candidatus Cloacimonadota bacterium]MDD4156177.1 DUF5694 domain-containing protein [Candidatus Cloacimonadota bacterium]